MMVVKKGGKHAGWLGIFIVVLLAHCYAFFVEAFLRRVYDTNSVTSPHTFSLILQHFPPLNTKDLSHFSQYPIHMMISRFSPFFSFFVNHYLT